MAAQILPFPERKVIRTREDAVDQLSAELAAMLEEGDTLMVIPDKGAHFTMKCQNGETLTVHSVEPPADCPA